MGGLTAVALLVAWPALAPADDHGWYHDDTGWMPSWWTPAPPTSHAIDGGKLAEFLLKKGIISAQELALLQSGEAAQAKASVQPGAVSQRVSR
jgi:hypothetical protein